MARVHRIPEILHFFIYFSIFSCYLFSLTSANRELDEDNWRDILEGEWMVELWVLNVFFFRPVSFEIKTCQILMSYKLYIQEPPGIVSYLFIAQVLIL